MPKRKAISDASTCLRLQREPGHACLWIQSLAELRREATVKIPLTVQREGDREVSRKLDFYNLDAIIAIDYRANSYQATQFRIWATKTLREFMVKGFVLDDERRLLYAPDLPRPV